MPAAKTAQARAVAQAHDRKFGAHMSIAGGCDRAVWAAHAVGFATVQLFTKNNNQWKAPASLGRACRRVSRGARPDGRRRPGGPHLVPDQPRQPRRRTLAEIDRRDDRRGRALRAPGNRRPGRPSRRTHGRGRRSRAGADRQGPRSRCIAARAGLTVTIDLETTAGQGTNLGYRFEHLQAILQRVKHPERLGVCVDTCHIFAAGYSLGTQEEYDEMIERLDRAVALERVRVWHVNDSGRERGSRVDRHAAIGAGCMGLEPFRHLVNDPRFRDLPLILETPKGVVDGEDLDVRNLRVLRRLVRRAQSFAQARLRTPDTIVSANVRPAVLPRSPAVSSRAPHWERGGAERMAMSITQQFNGQPVTRTEAAAAGRGPRSELVHQSRADLARFQRARARRSARPVRRPCSSGSGSWRSARRTSTSSSRSGSPGCRPSSTKTSSRRTRPPTAWARWPS